MKKNLQISLGVAAVVCLLAALDTWMGAGGVTYLANLANVEEPTDLSGEQGAAIFFAAALILAGIGLILRRRANRTVLGAKSSSEAKVRRRLIVAIVYVARMCGSTTPRDVAEAYRSVTGELPGSKEIVRAAKYLRSGRGASVDKVMAGAEPARERRRILLAVSRLWFWHGVESQRATQAIERIATALGFEGDDMNAALDEAARRDSPSLIRDFDVVARRTIRRVSTGAQRISSRILGVG